MVTDAELSFADQVGKHFARFYSLPPVTGRVLGWLLICEPPEQTAAQLTETLQASRSAVSGAVSYLETGSLVQRTRPAGSRVDLICLHPDAWVRSFEAPGEYTDLAKLVRQGVEALDGSPPARLSRLLEAGAMAEFLAERLPRLRDEWIAHRDGLRAKGELPDG